MKETAHSLSSHLSEEVYDKTNFGFWVYILTDCILFGTLFATFAVVHKGTAGGPSGKELFSLPFVLAETLVLLLSSFTCGLGMLAAHTSRTKLMLGYIATFILGATFLYLEVSEFAHFVREGNSWERSAFLSAFFTLVGTHGLHITVGLIWMAVMMFQVMQRGVTETVFRRLSCLRMFWHFLDVIWIFIFTIVYLMGVIE
ncbi:MAG: cytochrome o ubiquinol oxidase subunit III [Chlamydiales bacterium]|nr:cytochrome o ubiquinol oxidase subunit III [Chlamydiales bacterium]